MIAKENTHKRWTNHSGKADSLACRAGREGGVVQLLHLTPDRVQRSWLDANEQGRGWVLIHASAQRLLYLKIDNNFVNIVSNSAWHLIKTPSIRALLRIFQRAHAMAAKANRYMCLDFPFIP
jgi:hypothetical protein